MYTENTFIQNTQFINLYKNHNSLQNIIIKDSIFKSHLNSFYLNINKNDDINIINSEFIDASIISYCDGNNNGNNNNQLNITQSQFKQFNNRYILFIDTNNTNWSQSFIFDNINDNNNNNNMSLITFLNSNLHFPHHYSFHLYLNPKPVVDI